MNKLFWDEFQATFVHNIIQLHIHINIEHYLQILIHIFLIIVIEVYMLLIEVISFSLRRLSVTLQRLSLCQIGLIALSKDGFTDSHWLVNCQHILFLGLKQIGMKLLLAL